jgi:alanine racemase
MPRPIRAVIDLAALRHNLGVARRHAPQSRIFAVLKADAYGHGIERARKAVDDADGIAVLDPEVAAALRSTGYAKRIALLEGVFEVADLALAARHEIAIVVHSEEQLQLLDSAPADAPYDVLVKINTGLNRLGFPLRAAPAVIERLRSHRAVQKLTLMTHFATADDARGVDWQQSAFERMASVYPYERSAANSAAVLRHPPTHAGWVRPGIMLYGCTPFADTSAQALGLKPAMTLTSELIAVQELAPGDRVGYGSTFEAPRAMRVGVVACGYADGYPRHAPTGTPILVGGQRTATLGRVSMDMLCADLSGVAHARVGTPVTLWGEGLSADEVALAAGTVGYELLCALAPRVHTIERGE